MLGGEEESAKYSGLYYIAKLTDVPVFEFPRQEPSYVYWQRPVARQRNTTVSSAFFDYLFTVTSWPPSIHCKVLPLAGLVVDADVFSHKALLLPIIFDWDVTGLTALVLSVVDWLRAADGGGSWYVSLVREGPDTCVKYSSVFVKSCSKQRVSMSLLPWWFLFTLSFIYDTSIL